MSSVNYEVMQQVIEDLGEKITETQQINNNLDNMLNELDPRVGEFLKSSHGIEEQQGKVDAAKTDIANYQNWLEAAVQKVKDTDSKLAGDTSLGTSNINGIGAGGTGVGAVVGGGYQGFGTDVDDGKTDTESVTKTEDYFINPEDLKNLSAEAKEQLRNMLKQLGYTDEEIEKILNGEVGIPPEDYEELKALIEKLKEKNPDVAEELEDILDIEDPFPDDEKGPGTVDDGDNDNTDGDGLDHGDNENITQPDDNIDSENGNGNGDNGNDSNNINGGDNQNGGNQLDESKTETGTSIGGSVVGVGGTVGEGGKDTSEVGNAAATSAKDGLGKGIDSIMSAIGKGAAKLTGGVTPYSGGNGTVSGSINSASAGIIAAASLAAGGSAAGGGLLLGKKLSTIRFTPEDWESLGEDYQGIIEKLMINVGFTDEERETFKTSNFKIATSELKEHVKKIDKATENSTDCEEELLKQYGFSMIDENGKVIDYLLFITMIVDGKNSIDEFNMYNIINQHLENVNESDFIYAGISMEDYIDNEEEEEEIKIANDPTEEQQESPEEKEEETSSNESEESSTSVSTGLDKEWLKGIGIDD